MAMRRNTVSASRSMNMPTGTPTIPAAAIGNHLTHRDMCCRVCQITNEEHEAAIPC